MNAPDPITPPDGASLVARAPIRDFGPSLTNRKHRPEHIQALAASIAEHGVIQPILARPWPDSRPNPDNLVYEIVVGEGRWLGAIAAGEADIPFFWRDLGDTEAVELHLVENLQRDDISPLEEAEIYRRLLDAHGHTADTIAAKIGKSRSSIYARLKLLDLCAPARQYLVGGTLDASRALLIARVPVPDLQAKAAKAIAEGGSYGTNEPLSYRQASEMLQRKFMLRLSDAPFPCADADLLPAAGRCHDCPKRTGNQAELYYDVKSADICTDPGCYDAKKAAHAVRQRALAKASGIKIIEGAEAKKIKPNSYSDHLAGGYTDLDQKVWQDGKQKTVRQILGKDAPAAEAILVDPHDKGKVSELVATATIKDKLAAKGRDVPAGIAGRGKSDAEKAAERKRKQEALFRQRLFDTTRGAIAVSFDTREDDSVLDLREFRMVADRLFGCLQFEDRRRLARLWIGPTDKSTDHELTVQLDKRIPSMGRKDCARLLLEDALVGESPPPTYGDHPPANLLATAEALDIDADAIKRGVIGEMREKAKAKAKPKATKSSAQRSDPSTAAQAKDKAATAAPAGPKGRTPRAKKPKAKADPAPALPANEPASPANTAAATSLLPAWPFPAGAQ